MFLAAYNNVVNLIGVPRAAYVPLNLAVGALLILVARRAGLSWTSLGFDPGQVPTGLRWGLGIAGVILAGLLVALALPVARPLLADQRIAGMTVAGLAYTMIVRVPLGTALFEEVAFRGVLLGMGAERWTTTGAVVVSSAVFGLWHIGPSLELLWANRVDAAPAVLGLWVAAAVAGTAVGGVILCWLRLRTGGLLAPVVVHAAANSLATGAAFVAQRGT